MSIPISRQRLWIALVALLAAVVFWPGRAHAANVTVDVCATTGNVALPAAPTPVNTPIWGYVSGNCSTAATATAPGGPVIVVNQGDVVTVNLRNNLPEATGLLFQGIAIRPDLTGAGSGTTKSYTFTASQPGTYLYEAALLPNAQHQVAMGLYGVLIVRPATANQAYGPGTAYDEEAVVVLSEIDPALNAAPTTFDMRNYAPKYWLINGQVYPNTANIATAAGHKVLLRYVNAGMQHHSMAALGLAQNVVATDGIQLANPHTIVAETIAPGQTLDAIVTTPAAAPAGSKFAVYDANVILHNGAMAGYGGMLTFIALAGGAPGPDTTGPATSAPTLTPNPTNGAAPVTLAAGISDAATGGANVTAAEYFVDAVGANGAGCAITNGLGGATANVSAVIPASAAAAPCAGLASLTPGSHTIYVHGQDSLGNWGPANFVVLSLDKAGPATNGLALSANPTNGTVNVTLTGTANDGAAGNSNIAAAEYFIGTAGANGSGAPLTPNTTAAPIASLSATIPAATINALAQGSYVVNVHSRDAFGNWGAFATISLKVDKSAPTVSGAVTAKPNPTNGQISGSAAQPAVQLDATFVDGAIAAAVAAAEAAEPVAESPAESAAGNAPVDAAAHLYLPLLSTDQGGSSVDTAAAAPGANYVATAEGFVFVINDHAPTPAEYGTGFVWTANDGLFDSASEAARGMIPLNTVLQLSNGNHTVYVHAKDNSGNWGPLTTLTLLVDKVAPSFTGIALSPNSVPAGTATVTLDVTGAADNAGGAGVAGGEYWFGTTDPAPGGGTAFSGLSTPIPVSTLALGTYTVRARVRDGAGNWSANVQGATLTVTRPPFYFSTFGNTNPPGVGGTADDADIYYYNGTGFSRAVDVTAITNPIPAGANVDGLVRTDNTHFYVSFADDTTLPGLGAVQDEDIVYYNGGTWSVYFDGTARGLTNANQDIDAFDIVGGVLYFSTVGNTNPPGVTGTADDANIYTWNGTAFSRVFAATVAGLPTGANIDGLSLTDATHFVVSFSADTSVPGIGTVQDEDLVRNNGGTWSVYVDGTALGLTSSNSTNAANLDIDAFDLP